MDSELVPQEELLFSKAALKYSKNLKKDDMISGYKLLVQQAGRAMTQNRHVSLEFTFGRLVCQNFTVSFAFSQQFLQTAEVPAVGRTVDDIAYTTSPLIEEKGSLPKDLAPLATPRAATPRAATPRTPGTRRRAPLSAAAANSLQKSPERMDAQPASVVQRLDDLLAITSSTLQKKKPWVDPRKIKQNEQLLS